MTLIFKFIDFRNFDVFLFSNMFLESVRYLVLAGEDAWTEFSPWNTNSRRREPIPTGRCLISTYVLRNKWVHQHIYMLNVKKNR